MCAAFVFYFKNSKIREVKNAALQRFIYSPAAPPVLMGMRVALIPELLGPDLLGLFVLLFAAAYQTERQKAEHRATRKANATKNKIHTIFPLFFTVRSSAAASAARFCEEKSRVPVIVFCYPISCSYNTATSAKIKCFSVLFRVFLAFSGPMQRFGPHFLYAFGRAISGWF
jgi:hypothetical protein